MNRPGGVDGKQHHRDLELPPRQECPAGGRRLVRPPAAVFKFTPWMLSPLCV